MNDFRLSIPPLHRPVISVLALFYGLSMPLTGSAQVPPQVLVASGKTNTFLAPNGVPVVNIDTANAAGLSYNRYSQFNVDSRGLILNNGNNAQMTRDAKLASQVMANLNLQAEAKVILNEVVVPNRSTLAGYIEVLGSKADVILANQYGITCDGCGFINVPRATLTTGVPVLGGDGSLSGFNVNTGDVLIQGNGLDAKTVNVLDIVARSIKVDGQVNAQDLQLVAGANRFDYATRNASATAPSGTAPTYAIDSTVLGGMYANRIKLVATEAGVGVRMLGDAAATGDNLSLDSAGKITLQNKMSAQQDLHVSTTVAGADALTLTGASLAAGRNVDMTATTGGVVLTSGSGDNIYGAGTLSISGNGSLEMNDAKVRADGNLSLASTAGNINITSGGSQQIASTAGNIQVTAGGNLSNTGYVSADAGSLTANITGSVTNSGTIYSKTNSSLTIGQGLTNSGSMAADGNLGLAVNGTLTNASSGSLYAKSGLTITDASGNGTENISNAGKILADGTLSVKANAITNAATGAIQGSNGTTLTADSLDNSGKFIGSSNAGTDASLTLRTLTNQAGGAIQTSRDLSLNVTETLNNSGKVLGGRNLNISGTTAGTTLAVTNNSGGTLQAGSTLQLSGASAGDKATLSNAGTVMGDALNLTVTNLTNTGLVQGGDGTNAITVTQTVDNQSGATMTLSGAAGSATLQATTITNAGTLQSRGNALLKVGSTLTNSGKLLGNADLAIRGNANSNYNLTVSGTLQAAGALSIKGYGDGKKVNISVGSTGVVLGGTGDINATTTTLNDGAKLSTSGNLTLATDTLNMAGSNSKILAATAGGNADITVANAFTNNGMMYSGGNLDLTAPTITNSSTGGMVARNALTVTASSTDLTNSGAIYGGDSVTLNASHGTFTNVGYIDHAQGTVDSGGDVSITANTVVNRSAINATGSITISAPTFLNEVAGGDTRTWVYNSNFRATSHTDSWYSFPDNYETEYHDDYWTNYQYYAGGKPTYKPQIIGGSTVTINNFSSGANRGGVISGNTVNISGVGGGATFVNDDLHLNSQDWVHHYEYYTHYIALGPAKYDNHVLRNDSTGMQAAHTIDTIGPVGLFATTLNASGFALVNAGSPYAASPNAQGSQSGPTAQSLAAAGSAASSVAPVTFGGITLVLPTNPNGYFVVTQDPKAHYLVEANPLFGVGQNFVGSDYLEQRYGYNPDTVQKHLGDTNYEAWLVRQQLVVQTGKNILQGYPNEADQVKALFDNAFNQSKSLGLTYGKEPTAEQQANIKQDMVWMVSKVVNGQEVLVPVVYLSQKTKDAIVSGAAIVGDEVNLNLTSLSNTGGTIAGNNNLNIRTEGDITNVSGTIKGGNVNLSAGGDITNRTLEEGNRDIATALGKTGTIQADNKLKMDAANDIKIIGGSVKAGGDASISAGRDVVLDTVVKADAQSKASSSSGFMRDSSSYERTVTNKNVGADITTGNNLSVKSGRDMTIAGSSVNAGKDLSMDAKGDMNIISRQDTAKTVSTHSETGIGAGGGVFGASHTQTDTFEGKNAASTISAGGNASLSTDKTLTLQGSDLKIKGDADIAAEDVKILAGKDEKRTHTESTSIAIGMGASGETTGSAKAGAEAGASGKAEASGFGFNASASGEAKTSTDGGGSSKSESDAGGKYSSAARTGSASVEGEASAKASASAEGTASGTVKLAGMKTEKTDTLDQTARGSTLAIGGNLKIRSKKDITLEGADVNAGGNVGLEATNVNIMAAQDVHTKTTETTEVGLNLSTANKGSASAEAGASAKGSAKIEADVSGGKNTGGGIEASGSVEAGAEAKAKGSSENSLSLSVNNTKTNDVSIKNRGTSIKSGGNVDLKAKDTITMQAANVEAGGDVSQTATNIKNVAADDVELHTKESKTVTVGVYAGGEGEASASAKAKAEGNLSAGTKGQPELSANASAQAKAKADAEVGYGLSVGVDLEKSASGKTTAVVSSIKAGGNVNRTATNKIEDVGSNIEAGGDVTQSAQTIDMKAAKNTSFSTSQKDSYGVKIGEYASGSAGADAQASAGTESGGDASAGARAQGVVGFKAGFTNNSSSDNAAASEAVVGNIKAGGNIKSTSSGATTMEGTKLSSGGDTEITASKFDYKAAQNTQTSSSESRNIDAGIKVGGGGSAWASTQEAAFVAPQVQGGLNAKFDTNSSNAAATQAVVGGIESGGNVKIKTTQGDLRLEGTNVKAQGGTTLDSAGAVRLDQAQDTASSSSKSINGNVGINFDVGGGKKSGSLEAGGGFDRAKDASTTAVTGSIDTGGPLTIKSGSDVTIQGADLKSGGDASIDAKGNVNFEAARSTASSDKMGVQAGIALKGEKDGGDMSGSGSVDAKYGQSQSASNTAKAGSLQSGGNLTISSGKDTRLEGTNLAAEGDMGINAGGNVKFDAARSTSSASSMDVSAGLGGGFEKKADSKGGEGKLNVGFGMSNEQSSTAQAGSAAAGGKLNITSGGAASFEGTGLTAGGDASINAKGPVTFEAAKSTQSSSSLGVEIGAEAKVSRPVEKAADAGTGTEAAGGTAAAAKPDFFAKRQVSAGPAKKEEEPTETKASTSASGKFGFNMENSQSTDAQAGFIKSGGNVAVTSGSDVKFEGTKIKAAGDTAVDAAGNVTFDAARSTSSSSKIGVSVGGGFNSTDTKPIMKEQTEAQSQTAGAKPAGSAGAADAKAGETKTEEPPQNKKNTSINGNLGVDVNMSQANIADAGAIESGGDVKIRAGNNARFEGTSIQAGGSAGVEAGGKVTFDAARSTSSSTGVNLNLDANGSKEVATPAGKPAAGQTGAAGSAGATPSDAKVTKNGGAGLGFGVDVSNANIATTGGITAGKDVAIKAGSDASFEGTQIKADGKASVQAGGDINLKAANSSSNSFGIGATVGADSDKQSGVAGGRLSLNNQQGGQAASISGAEGTTLSAVGKVTTEAAQATSKQEFSVSGGLGMSVPKAPEKKTPAPAAGGDAASTPATKPGTPAPDAPKPNTTPDPKPTTPDLKPTTPDPKPTTPDPVPPKPAPTPTPKPVPAKPVVKPKTNYMSPTISSTAKQTQKYVAPTDPKAINPIWKP